MLKKISMIALMTICIYSIIPLTTIIAQLGISDYTRTLLTQGLMTLINITYILSFVDLYFIVRKSEYYKLIKLALIVKLLFIPVIFIILLLGILTLIVIIGSGIIGAGLLLGIYIMFLTSIYSSVGIYLFYKNNNIKYKKLWLVLQWCFPLDIISLIIFIVKINKDKLVNKNC